MKWNGDSTYFAALRDAAEQLLAMHDTAPRVVRYVASRQKWLITQAIVALHFERKHDEARPPLTAGSLIDFFAEHQPFSKNTLTAHLAELRTYGLLVPLESRDKRVKPLQLSPYGEALVGQWLESHLSALDRMDGGNRTPTLTGNPHLLARIHPLAIRALVFDPAWAEPPASVDLFVRTESGSNILHELICRLPTDITSMADPIRLGPLHASEVSTRHTLSRGHVQRVFSRARAEGLLIWSLPGNQGDLFVSGRLLQDYASWQGVKFQAISDAYGSISNAVPRSGL
jgi:DNA-binding IscR family transcriptional regulator